MNVTKQLGNATICADIDDSMWVDTIGDSVWRFQKRDIERIESEFDMFGTRLYERTEDLDDYEEPDDFVEFHNVDAGILIVACMLKLGGEWSIEWSGESEYWFFHDLDHAEFDVWVGGEGTRPDFSVEGESEVRALVNGAQEAIRAGVDLSSVCQQLAQAEKQFEERFSYQPARLWENSLAGIVASHQNETVEK